MICPKLRLLKADPEYPLMFHVPEHSSNEATKPWTGWSMTRGEVVTGLDPAADFTLDKVEPIADSKDTQNGTATEVQGVFPCDRCGRSYIRKDSLRRHLKYECGKEPAFQCPFCPQRCKRKAHQIRHIHRQHSDMIDYADV
jgi:uncharacterized Zn-finger protein